MDGQNCILEPPHMALLENLGYALLPKPHKESPGYSGLIVVIRKVPTNSHFDPESIGLWIRGRNGLADRISFTLESHPTDPVQVCPGGVILTDRHDKRVDFFTFGGHLETATEPDERIFFLHSRAPILEIFNDLDSFSDQLAFEIEGLLARLHALWALNDEGFARKMAQVDPVQLYLASLKEIVGRYEQNQTLRSSWPGFYSKLFAEKDWLLHQGQWPTAVSAPEDLLAPIDAEQDGNLRRGDRK